MAMLGFALCFLLAGCFRSDAPETDGIQRGSFIWSKTIRGNFEEVLENIQSAASRKNFPVGTIRNYKKSIGNWLEQTGEGGKFPYAEYLLVEYCNVSLALRALRIDARLGVFLPCRMLVYTRPGSDEITMITVNPHFMPEVLNNAGLNDVAEEVEEVVLEIFNSANF